MNRHFRFFIISIILVVSNCVFIPQVDAQFTIIEDFHSGTMVSKIIAGGAPNPAFLTSGNVDAANDGWLRLTDAEKNQKGYAYINSTFPSTLGVLIDFQYTTWRTVPGDNGADGIGVYFFDATATFALGGWGGSLGYAPNTTAGTPTGLAGGYIGIGLDEFGNFSHSTEGRIGGPGLQCNSITLRGETTNNPLTTNKYLKSVQLQTDPLSDVNSIDYNQPTSTRPTDAQFYRRVKISIVPTGTTTTPKYTITVMWKTTTSGSYTTLLTYDTTTPPPPLLKVGFAASTGGSYNYHELRNLTITTPGGVRVDKDVDKSNVKVGDQLTYTVNAYNSTNSSLTNLGLTDVLKDGVGNVIDVNSSDVFTVNSITFNDNGYPTNTAVGYTNGVPITSGFTNPFSVNLNMAANSMSTFTIVGTVKNLPAGGGVLKNYATVDPSLTGITDEDMTNNDFSVSSHVLNADFVIDNGLDNSCGDPANGNAYTLLVSNKGTESSMVNNAVTVTDNIPAGLTVTGISASGWTVSNSGSVYTFKRSDALASGAAYPPITINFKPLSTGTWVNTATVAYAGVEASTSNNSGSVTLNSKPGVPIVNSPVSYCQGDAAVVLTATGNGLLWYNVITGGVGSSTAPVPGTATVGSKTYYVSQNDGNCESARSPIVVVVKPLPTATVSGTTVVCQNAANPSITFTGTGGTAPYTFAYTVNGGVTQTISTTIGNSVAVPQPTLVAGAFVYSLLSVKDAGTTCLNTNQSGTATVTINPLPTATVSGTTSVCQNAASPNITFTGAGGIAPYTFTYTVNGGAAKTISTMAGNSVTVPQPTSVAGAFVYSLVSIKDASATTCINNQSGSAVVTVNMPTSSITNASICQGYVYTFNSVGYNNTGTYVSHFTNKAGCDSTAILNLTVKLPTASTTNVAICKGESYLFNGTTYGIAGTYAKHLTNKQGCDSTATLNLTIKQPTTSLTNASICEGDSYTFNGTGYTTAGIFNKHFVNAVGCDSTATLVLKVKLPTSSTTVASICQGDTYTFNGVVYAATGTYSSHFVGVAGCDSTAILMLTIQQPTTSTTNASICQGDSYLFCGTIYNAAGTYIGHATNMYGCDSTATLNLSVKFPTTSTTNSSICQGDSYLFNGATYTTAGTYVAHLINKQGCDSVATLNLTVKMSSSSVTNASICRGDSYLFNGTAYTDAGKYNKHLVNAIGCDSLVSLVLTVRLPTNSTTRKVVSSTKLPFVWNQMAYSEPGTHTCPTHFVNAAGCDSTATLILAIKVPASSTTKASICDGDSYLFNGVNYSIAGTYTAHLIDAVGIDSTAILNLSVNSIFNSQNSILLISGESYFINGHSYNESGIYTDVLKTTYGCDSTVVTDLTIIKVPNTFTPNGDGYNDMFMKGWHVKIYNRNGIILYDGTKGWDGTYNNKPVSKDTYFYVLYYTSGSGTKSKEGYLMVIP